MIYWGKIPANESYTPNASRGRTVALLPWGDLIEDFLDTIGVSLEAFCKEMSGGWLFGYIDALRLVGVKTVVFCISARVEKPTRYTNLSTGATICVLPVSKSYRRLRRRMLNPHGLTEVETFGKVRGLRRVSYALLRDIAPYLATPMRLLARELLRERCKAILCQEYEYARFDVCVLLGKLLRIPVFATFQGGVWHLSHFERFLRPLTIRACSGLIIAPQSEVRRVHTKYSLSCSKIARIFTPIDFKMWGGLDRDETRAVLNIRSTTRVVVWHGRVEMHRKGLDILLKAWEIICHKLKGQDLRLLLVGAGNDVDKLHRRIISMHLEGVNWVDKYLIDRHAIRRYLSAGDVYIFPSRHEGFPVAPLEAMACGLPVVATDASGISDILEDIEDSGGLIVPREDAIALAAAIALILDDEPWRRTLSKRARRRVEKYFSLEAVGKQLRNFLC